MEERRKGVKGCSRISHTAGMVVQYIKGLIRFQFGDSIAAARVSVSSLRSQIRTSTGFEEKSKVSLWTRIAGVIGPCHNASRIRGISTVFSIVTSAALSESNKVSDSSQLTHKLSSSLPRLRWMTLSAVARNFPLRYVSLKIICHTPSY